ncbi:AAA family ATPase [Streptomyces sp. VRA16 Mangrove soil]|uniref:ATP-binding protein n=1 Tax=Streptomyces sp. VRA16 Mangrove soil TaxID=2817434 RepID=UPI001A9F6868|nr:helix-turn-helix transcriptional regulator [Streptomyces sp. VRA16 Mangrove soil]MBO1334373.1 AAA family ATPase [Streptomyces sp. VRA16 Mangrove soil]
MILGRSAELTAIVDALASITSVGTALVIEGEAGIGKSTLLASVAEQAAAEGYRLLSCSGLQSQTEVGFAGIHELIHPLLGQAATLPRRQHSALMTSFGLEDGPAPDRLLVSLAVLGLLEEAAAQQRLLLVVDDVQWLDQTSLDVLAFVARRLTNAPLMLLCAERSGLGGSAVFLEGTRRLPLGPLQHGDAQELLEHTLGQSPGEVDAYLQQRVLEQANGNPLAVIELSAGLAERPDDTATFSGEPLPTSQRVEHAFLAQLEVLSEGPRLLLLLIAAAHGPMAEIHAAAQDIGLDFMQELAPLQRASLVTAGSGQLHVRHPLIRSTVYGAALLSDRARVHRALANATTDPTRAAWHRAEATLGPDERVAADLERAAERTQARGAGAESAAALRRAATLSPVPEDRLRRLTAAADIARGAGLTTVAISILKEAEPLARALSDRQSLAITRFVLAVTASLPGESATELVALAGESAAGDPRQRELLWAAAIECRMHGLREAPRQALVSAIHSLGDTHDDPLIDVAMALVDDVGDGLRLQQRLPAVFDRFGDKPLPIMALGFAAEAVSDRVGALRCWTYVQNQSQRRSSAADECEGLRGSAQLLLQQGNLQAAVITAQNAQRMAEDMALPMTAASAAAYLARALVWQGHEERARQALDRCRELLAADPLIVWNDDAHWAAGMAALCAANYAEALPHLLRMSLHRTSRRWAVADLAEAAAGCDQHDLARPVLADIEEQVRRLDTPLDNLLVHRAHALLARTDDETEDRFQAALKESEGLDAELELARTHLLYGEWLRRHRRIVDARTHLTTALTAFDAAGATAFTNRATAELRAAGVTLPGRTQLGPVAALTPQELQIAQLAAAGLSNREIADRIYLSHRTVATHLYKVFPKLAIKSRRQLPMALGEAAHS